MKRFTKAPFLLILLLILGMLLSSYSAADPAEGSETEEYPVDSESEELYDSEEDETPSVPDPEEEDPEEEDPENSYVIPDGEEIAPEAEPDPGDSEAEPEDTASADDQILRIGLFWDDNALEGANLLNYVGRGYDFGYFDDALHFVPLYSTEERAISMLKDWSLYYDGGQYTSEPAYSGGIRVGCYHIRLGICDSLRRPKLWHPAMRTAMLPCWTGTGAPCAAAM